MRALIILIALFAFSYSNAQKIVYFPGFELINMNATSGLQYSTSKLIKSYIENNHEYTIILDEQVGSSGYAEKEGITVSTKKALEMSAPYIMRGEIHYLQGVYIISLGIYRTPTNEQVWHDMAKGSTEQDLDPLLSRLGRSFLTNSSAKTAIEIDEVTEYDQNGVELAQIKVNHFVGIMLGGKHVFNEGVLSGFGLAYTYDASTILFNFDFELYPSSNLIIDNQSGRRLQNGNVNLGVMYPLSRKRTTLFINGGMEYGYATVKDTYLDQDYRATDSGIGAYVGGGLLINRNSTVNLKLFTAVSIPFYQVDGVNLTGIKFGIVTSFARKH
ncbi:hypothetical protein [Ekhidna sp.]